MEREYHSECPTQGKPDWTEGQCKGSALLMLCGIPRVVFSWSAAPERAWGQSQVGIMSLLRNMTLQEDNPGFQLPWRSFSLAPKVSRRWDPIPLT